ncbi:MAG: (2Fe-2S) ferredoxin domain-containing protein [Desulfobacterota bacterium]|nr:(2Fe-2S) ferredoxin domain-containing protein [Thermodesulfobacteriota bacterium]
MAALTADDLAAIASRIHDQNASWIRVGMSTCGIAAGAERVYAALEDELQRQGAGVQLKKCGCLGMCAAEPLVEVNIAGMPRVIYCRVDEACARDIVRGHVCGGKLLQDYIIDMQSEDAS